LCGVFLAQGNGKNYPRLISWSFWITGIVFALLALALPFINYTHGEEVYMPVVLPFIIYLAACLLSSGWVFLKTNRPHFIVYSILISYVVLFTCGAAILPGIQFPERYSNPQARILR